MIEVTIKLDEFTAEKLDDLVDLFIETNGQHFSRDAMRWIVISGAVWEEHENLSHPELREDLVEAFKNLHQAMMAL